MGSKLANQEYAEMLPFGARNSKSLYFLTRRGICWYSIWLSLIYSQYYKRQRTRAESKNKKDLSLTSLTPFFISYSLWLSFPEKPGLLVRESKFHRNLIIAASQCDKQIILWSCLAGNNNSLQCLPFLSCLIFIRMFDGHMLKHTSQWSICFEASSNFALLFLVHFLGRPSYWWL